MAQDSPAVLGVADGNLILWVPLLHIGVVRLLHLPCSVTGTTLELYATLRQAAMTLEGDLLLMHDPLPCTVTGTLRLRRNVFAIVSAPLFTFAVTSFRPAGKPNARLWWAGLEGWAWLIALALAAFRVLMRG